MLDISCIIFSKKLTFSKKGAIMKRNMVHHLSEYTNMYELHSHVCDMHTRSTPNFHKNLEMIVVLDGTCRLYVSSDSYVMKEGEAAFVMPYQIHHFAIEENSHIICTTFHEALINSMHEIIVGARPNTPVFKPSKSTYDYFCCQNYELFGKNSGEIKRIEPDTKRLKVKGLLYTMESEFVEQVSFGKIDDFETVTTNILNYVSENFKENITLKDIAANTGYNYQYVSRTFNSMMGMSFKQVLNLHRMQYAFRKLRRTDMSIIDIAYDSGFQSVRSFYRVCFELYGCSPAELRKRERRR